MKTYQVILTKSYAVAVKANSAKKAKGLAEFYTGDIEDISAKEDRKTLHFSIEEIKCCMNESTEAKEVKWS